MAGREFARGFVADGFGAVRREFERNFTDREDVGAAFAAVMGGELVVDLWGGTADAGEGRDWDTETLQVIFSGSKGLVAVCILVLIERGAIKLSAPVCEYWPEFAEGGKRLITVGDILSHRGRLPGLRPPISERDLTDDERMAALLAGQRPETDRRAGQIYHPLTYGWLCGELIRRVTGRSIGRFFAEEIARPLDLEIWIGLPAEYESRVSRLKYAASWGTSPQLSAAAGTDDELLARVWTNPPIFPGDHIVWNEPEFHTAEIPAVNAIGTARDIARLYGCLAEGGAIGGVRILQPETLALARRELSRFRDPLAGEAMAYGVGFQLQTELDRFGPPGDAFGHSGAGGSVHGGWPSHRVGFSYTMNLMRDDVAPDPRAEALLTALHESVTSRIAVK